MAAESIGSLSSENSDNTNGGGSDSQSDVNIFLPISIGVGLTGIGTVGLIFGLRQFIKSP